jgi:1-acyl-sn-glycerol-3-phosphate acyltransferase
MNRTSTPSSILFAGDTYITPPGREHIIHRLFLRSRLYYMAGFIGVVLRYWNKARKQQFDVATWNRAAFDIFQIIERCGGRFTISGLSQLDQTQGPVVFVANHMSTMETLIPPAFLYPRKAPIYVIKEQLLKVPFFGAYLHDCITVSRTSPTGDFKQVMTKGAHMIERGRSVIVFPQSTRTTELDPAQFNTLGVKLARKAGVPAVPIAFKTDFWGVGKIIKDFGPLAPEKRIFIEVGQPLAISGSGKTEHELIVEFISSRISAWRALEHEGRAGC